MPGSSPGHDADGLIPTVSDNNPPLSSPAKAGDPVITSCPMRHKRATSQCRRLLDPPLTRRMTAVRVASLALWTRESFLNAAGITRLTLRLEQRVARTFRSERVCGLAHRRIGPATG